MKRRLSAIPLLLTAASLSLVACEEQAQEPGPAPAHGAAGSPASQTPAPVPVPVPVPGPVLQPFQAELLDLAFEAVCKFPLDPHTKNRSRAQAAVVDACLALDDAPRALRYIEQIANWRRGAAYADLALHCAQRGDSAEVRRYLELAEKAAEELSRDPTEQEWRSDQIRVKIAQTLARLGEGDRAAELEADVVDSEAGKVAAIRASALPSEAFAAEIAGLDATLASSSFERVRNALATCVRLFERFYGDPDKRQQAELRVRRGSAKLPPAAQIGLLAELAEAAVDHSDPSKALALLEDADKLVRDNTWPAEEHTVWRARLAGLRGRAGDVAAARRELETALDAFDAARDDIVDIYRAGALRPVAEAYDALGDRAAALAIYKRAVAEGLHNPNSRPRAMDLAATCISLAIHSVEPDAELHAELLSACDGLGDPW